MADESFISNYGDDASFWLGEFALADGRPTEARRHWERVSSLFRFKAKDASLRDYDGFPIWLLYRTVESDQQWQEVTALVRDATSQPRTWLTYPDTNMSPAEVGARLVLASIWSENLDRAEIELKLFQSMYPGRAGQGWRPNGQLANVAK